MSEPRPTNLVSARPESHPGGFRDPAEVGRWLTIARSEPQYLALRERDKRCWDELLAVLLEAAAAAPDPDATLRCGLDLLLRMAEWPRYLKVLAEHPGGLARLVSLIAASPWLAQLLIARPALADELLPGRYNSWPPDRASLSLSLAETLGRCSDDETSQLIALRNFKHSCLLHILALDLEGALDLARVSGALSDLAEVLLGAVLQRVSARLGFATPPIGIVAYGKLGSREMSYASDTDIVFLHDDVPAAPLPQLMKLAIDVSLWLSAPTAAGILYETDFRLRPYGASGLLVTSLSSFRDYQMNAAWTWEHQALIRARFIAGDTGLGTTFANLRNDVLLRPRNPDKLRSDVLAMRERIWAAEAAEKRAGPPGSGPTFDVKHSRGGIIDVEFIVQHLILRWAPEHPALVNVNDTGSALAAAAALGLIPPALAFAVTEAYHAYRGLLHRERLRGNEVIKVDLAQAQGHPGAVKQLWTHVFESEKHNA